MQSDPEKFFVIDWQLGKWGICFSPPFIVLFTPWFWPWLTFYPSGGFSLEIYDPRQCGFFGPAISFRADFTADDIEISNNDRGLWSIRYSWLNNKYWQWPRVIQDGLMRREMGLR